MVSHRKVVYQFGTFTVRRQHLVWYVLCVALVVAVILLYRRARRPRLAGLQARDKALYLNDRKTRIISGAMHYFRVVPEYWRDRMLKMKAAGLNTVETYSPWNLHEETKGKFNFAGLLDIRRFVELAGSLDLMVILRPGPFICAEWEFGGLPSWLLRDPAMKLRQPYRPYLDAVELYLAKVMDQIKDLQYSEGGPIIAFQIENEFSFFSTDVEDLQYMLSLKQMFRRHGVKELLLTSDNRLYREQHLPGVLRTANFYGVEQAKSKFTELRQLQPDKPLMVMEYWSGWYDHWSENHNTMDLKEQEEGLRYILKQGASVNFYMFHGGTNFGFMNGANVGPMYSPTVTSYDYGAPISESGELTSKYFMIRRTLQQLIPGLTRLPEPPPLTPHYAYGKVPLHSVLPWQQLIKLVKPVYSKSAIPMELLDINQGSGQSFGFILYRKKMKRKGSQVKLNGYVRDRAQVFINDRPLGVWDWRVKDPSLVIDPKLYIGNENYLDILVENLGRVNFASKKSNILQEQFKGLVADVFLDNELLEGWDIYPLEFKKDFLQKMVSSHEWKKFNLNHIPPALPALYRGSVDISGTPKDTFLSMQGWQKGVVFVNDFNLGRYWDVGPQRTLYLPAPLLKAGHNELLIFELHKPSAAVDSVDQAQLK